MPETNIEIVSTFEVDEVWGKIYKLSAGQIVPQHQHEHDHVTILIDGFMTVWVEEKNLGQFVAPHAFHIKAGLRHTFKAMSPCTFCCLHNLRGTGLSEPEIQREHQLGDLSLEQL